MDCQQPLREGISFKESQNPSDYRFPFEFRKVPRARDVVISTVICSFM